MNTNNRLSWTLRQNFTDSHKKSPLCQYCIIFRIKSKSKKAERAYRGGDNCLLHAYSFTVFRCFNLSKIYVKVSAQLYRLPHTVGIALVILC